MGSVSRQLRSRRLLSKHRSRLHFEIRVDTARLETYLADIETTADNVLDALSINEPKHMVYHLKPHLLTHLATDIQRFDPLPGSTTERYEPFNAVFRSSSVLSNRHKPSRDIAIDRAHCERVKYTLLGKFVFDDGHASKTQVHCQKMRKVGDQLSNLLSPEDAKALHHLYGLPEKNSLVWEAPSSWYRNHRATST